MSRSHVQRDPRRPRSRRIRHPKSRTAVRARRLISDAIGDLSLSANVLHFVVFGADGYLRHAAGDAADWKTLLKSPFLLDALRAVSDRGRQEREERTETPNRKEAA